MTQNTIHNPDRYMVDLRQILSQGKKRIGVLIGAGAPVAMTVDENGKLSSNGSPIIPDVARLTQYVLDALDDADQKIIKILAPDLGENPNIETILTRVRKLSQAIGSAELHGLNGDGYEAVAGRICGHIGERVAATLPNEPNPCSELVSWIGGINRDHRVEVFSPNKNHQDRHS